MYGERRSVAPDKTTQGSTGNNVGVIVAGAPSFG